jgi:hypothetical protein
LPTVVLRDVDLGSVSEITTVIFELYPWTGGFLEVDQL